MNKNTFMEGIKIKPNKELKYDRQVLIVKLIILFIVFISVLVLPNFFIYAQTTSNNSECKTKEECEALLKEYEEQISQYEKAITTTQQEKKTLQNKISILKNKISKLNLEIKQSNLMIQDLGLQINDTEGSIEDTSSKIEDYKKQITDILRTIYKEDQKSYIEIFLEEDKISNFFNDLVALSSLDVKNQQILNEIKKLKTDLEEQKVSLDNEKEGMEKLVIQKNLQKQESQDTKSEQEQLLEETKGKEALYQKSLEETQAKAKEIRNRLFQLSGVPDTQAPTFGAAYNIAKYAESVTGVRPAFLLAVLTQESNIGKNVGKCYLPQDSAENKRRRIMSPTRDVPNFLKICAELGRDPYKTPVSCPMSFGWGGAMGPAQFIPSTWMKYRERVTAITGRPADPWNIRDAFLAAALYLSDYGAKSQTYNGEWRAAMIYFSGSTSTKYRFYGDSVMRIAAGYADDIQKIESLAISH
jgi:peptidoglycan hydrolase CwlO-like protein